MASRSSAADPVGSSSSSGTPSPATDAVSASAGSGGTSRLITADAFCHNVCLKPNALVVDMVYWLLEDDDGGILELHLSNESLALVELPPSAQSFYQWKLQLMEAEAGVLGSAGVKEYSLHLWAREANCDGTANWVLRTIINLIVFAPQPGVTSWITLMPPIKIVGVDEGSNFVFLRTIFGIFTVIFDDTALLEKVSADELMGFVHPYSSFFVAGKIRSALGDGSSIAVLATNVSLAFEAPLFFCLDLSADRSNLRIAKSKSAATEQPG
ncbi:unnamed protein product [Miscanthus lutarioriparius]|uniref:F-box protein AT5G49610-like beta-propeller domain-containing protein n=1 Tax=Miscanthus lutarioriparius TaxID=422564 RepID=A0A811MXJ9_9POAL|nr:unnamed protein product [Miscanthus lutarioriparius]